MYNTIDMHCDTLMEAYLNKADSLYSLPDARIDVEGLLAGNYTAQFFAIFMPSENIIKAQFPRDYSDTNYFEALTDIFNNTIKEHSDIIAFAGNYEDIQKNRQQKKLSALLTLEDGRLIDSKLENLDYYHQRGIRLITLTWNGFNCFGAPNSIDKRIMSAGLTPFGKEAIGYMNHLGIIIDLSHLSDQGFMDTAELSKKPLVASHSNCRAITEHGRNLTDEMIKILGNSGGVMGINFYPEFLYDGSNTKKGTLEMLCKHIKHAVNKGGIEAVAIGSDFDGFNGEVEISSPRLMPLLYHRLEKEGFNADDIDKIASGNVLRVIKESLK